MNAIEPIPTPWKQQWMRIRCQYLPFVSLGICVILTAVLWNRRVQLVSTVGEAQATETRVTAVASGVLLPLPQEIVRFQRVEQGQIIAKVDENTIVAPASGVVTAIQRRPGQTVRAGQAIMTITGEQPVLVLAYVRQDQKLKPAARMPVELRSRTSGGPAYPSSIERVGMVYQTIPQHQARDQKVTEWGVPVVIPIPPAMRPDLRPGELVDVRLKGAAPSASVSLHVAE